MSNEIISKTLPGIWLFLLITPLILSLLSVIAQYVWFRGKKEFHFAYGFQTLLFRKLNDLILGKGDWETRGRFAKSDITVISYVVYTFIGGVTFLYFPYKLIAEGHFTNVVIGLLCVAAFLFIPMICVDIYKAIKYNIRSGKAETIEQLQKDIASLKEQLKDK